MDEVMQTLNLSDDIRDALVSRQGGLGELLHVAELAEQSDYRHLGKHLIRMGISNQDALSSLKEAYKWRKGMA
jgi:c-di-GMP-related signal transduction protein